MNVTHDVIKDLLPLYLDGEASADTRRLVESFLATHPGLRAQADAAARVRRPEADIPQQDQALQTLERTKAALSRQKWMQFGAIFFTLAPFSFSFSGGQVTFWMLRDAPLSLIPLWASAAGFWFAYWRARRPPRQ